MRLLPIVVLLPLSLSAMSCEQSSAAAPNAGSVSASAASTVCEPGKSTPGCPEQAKPVVARIVFVGKEHACDCTRKTVDAGWAALQKALGTPPTLPVAQFKIDTEAEKVAPYRQQKPIMALPAIYFVDGKDVVLELLQGELTAEQIAGVLQAKTASP